MSSPVRFRLFAYGGFLAGEVEHDVLGGAVGKEARTIDGYALYELGPLAAMVHTKDPALGHVWGEVYEIDYETLAACDKKRGHPSLFHRVTVALEDGSEAETYLLHPEQVRGRRRVRHGSWKDRFKRERSRADDPALARWARNRFR